MASRPVKSEVFYRIAWKSSRPALLSSFETYFEDQVFTDATLSCKGETINCHKIVLAACSPFFEKTFKKNDTARTPTVINGVDFSQLLNILEFIYKGVVDIRPHDVAEFLRVAKALQVKGLSKNDYDDDEAMNTSSSGYAAESEAEDTSPTTENCMTPGAPTAHRTPFRKNFRHLKLPRDIAGKKLTHNKTQTRAYRTHLYKYKNYSTENLEAATLAVQNGISVLVAARENNVPSRTLYQHLNRLGIKPPGRSTATEKGESASTTAETPVADVPNEGTTESSDN